MSTSENDPESILPPMSRRDLLKMASLGVAGSAAGNPEMALKALPVIQQKQLLSAAEALTDPIFKFFEIWGALVTKHPAGEVLDRYVEASDSLQKVINTTPEAGTIINAITAANTLNQRSLLSEYANFIHRNSHIFKIKHIDGSKDTEAWELANRIRREERLDVPKNAETIRQEIQSLEATVKSKIRYKKRNESLSDDDAWKLKLGLEAINIKKERYKKERGQKITETLKTLGLTDDQAFGINTVISTLDLGPINFFFTTPDVVMRDGTKIIEEWMQKSVRSAEKHAKRAAKRAGNSADNSEKFSKKETTPDATAQYSEKYTPEEFLHAMVERPGFVTALNRRKKLKPLAEGYSARIIKDKSDPPSKA